MELKREERARQDKEEARQEKEKERQLEIEREEKARQEKEEERREKDKERQFELDKKERELQLEQERAKILAEREYEKSYEGLKTLIVQEQYLSTCPKEMAMHLKEGKPKTITELGDVAENYVEAHATDIVFGLDPKLPKFRSTQSPTRRCYRCGQAGRISSQCPRRTPDDSPASPPKTQGAPYAQQRAGYSSPQVPRTPARIQKSSQRRSSPRLPVPRCFLCNRLGHIARNCLTKSTAAVELQSQRAAVEKSQKEVAPCQPRNSISTYNADLVCKIHKLLDCLECNDLADLTHHCQAASMIAICQDCGTEVPVIADACQSSTTSHRIPVTEGSVEDTPVNVLRDTGCSTIIVRRALVPDDKLTGRMERCILIDGTVRYPPVAKIYVETPFFSGLTTAICMKDQIVDLVIGNVPGSRDVSIPQPVKRTIQAIQTRSHAKVTNGLTPLLTPLIDSGTEDVARLQSEEETLPRVLKSASSDKIDDNIPPNGKVAVEETIDEVTMSTAEKADEISDESVQPKPDLKYQYSEDQWSPLNPGGKKQYDRNFMLKLQYEPSSMTRPVNLPELPDIILNETTLTTMRLHATPPTQ